MSNDLALFPGVKLTRTALQLNRRICYEAWKQVMATLRVMGGSVQWWIGDGLNEGEKAYGEKYADAVDENEADTWMNYSWVSRSVEISRRREILSFNHHQEVARLEPAEQEYWLSQAEPLPGETKPRLSVHELRAAIRGAKLLTAQNGIPVGTYRVIYADPPWKYADELIEGYGAAEHHYPTMTLDELSAMKMPKIADHAVLFMWATSPILPDALKLIEAWDFKYKASFVWDKVKHNYGHYNSVRHELLLIATKGSCTPEVPDLFDSVQVIERAEHSRKPEEFRQMIDHLYPPKEQIDRIELFRRGAAIPKWATWGNEAK